MSQPSNEARLLRCCARIGMEEEVATRVSSILQSPLDWGQVIEDARRQGVAGLLHRHLSRLDGAAVPNWAMGQLSETYFEQAAHNLVLYRELGRVLRALHREGIEVVVLKGAALAEQLYGDIGLRPMNDLDLLVREGQLASAHRNLRALDYVPLRPGSAWRRGHHLPTLVCPDVGVPVDLHYCLTPSVSPFRIDIDEMWGRAEPARIGGVEALVFSPADMIFHLCLHATFHHHFETDLIHLCDIGEALRHYQEILDWRRFWSWCRRMRASRSVHLALSLVGGILGQWIPHGIFEGSVREHLDPEILALIEEQGFRRVRAPFEVPVGLSRALAAGGWWVGARVLLKSIRPGPDIAGVHHDGGRSWWRVYLHYGARLSYLLRAHGPLALRLMHLDRQAFEALRGEVALQRALARLAREE